MSRYVVLALLASVQVLFVAMLAKNFWALGRLVKLAKREEQVSRFVVSFLTTAAHRYGDDPVTVQGELLRCVQEYHEAAPVTARSFLQRLWRRR